MTFFFILLIAFIFVIAVIISNTFKSKPRIPFSYLEEDIIKEKTIPTDSIFYHEDDYCQIEILPTENYFELKNQAINIGDFKEENFDGVGFTNIQVREKPGLALANRKIKKQELEKVLSTLGLKKWDKITTGIRPGEMKSIKTIGYGQNYHAILFTFEGEYVIKLWIAGSLQVGSDLLSKTFCTLGKNWDLLLMDWNSLELILLTNERQVKQYLME